MAVDAIQQSAESQPTESDLLTKKLNGLISWLFGGLLFPALAFAVKWVIFSVTHQIMDIHTIVGRPELMFLAFTNGARSLIDLSYETTGKEKTGLKTTFCRFVSLTLTLAMIWNAILYGILSLSMLGGVQPPDISNLYLLYLSAGALLVLSLLVQIFLLVE